MKLRALAAATAALALTATPVLAQATQSAPVSRSVEASANESDLEGDTGLIVGILAAAAVVGAIILIADDDDDDEPASP
ncbi:hypothetical protein [Alterisphingorhabdus coralli]|uniref:Ferrochelatase n=1 Tax=Alterisphingorhabdus coralli TaxID=3071408 RepID=A0AA97I074_9SPHN|nr:hypothetical protein [Parasphingorhabdus sp. SCSIO 66989]WOE74597.1 hypothetical protein RB602_12175 [Parasphingorhabdus sp. SCSIO 66989]